MKTKFEKFIEKITPYVEGQPFYGLNDEYHCLNSYSLNDKSHYLLIGESGTGKEFEAEYIAKQIRSDSIDPLPFKNRFNCACTTPHNAIDYLFGHVKGAYTDAKETKTTIFTKSRRKSDPRPVVFLDELHRLPLEGQAALLRAIEYNELRLYGDDKLVTYSDCTNEHQECPIIIAAIQPNAIDDGSLLPDLKNRFSKEIYLPSLCETVNRIPGLTAIFICQTIPEKYWHILKIPEQMILDLAAHRWTGNIRQLKNIIYNAGEKHLNYITKYIGSIENNTKSAFVARKSLFIEFTIKNYYLDLLNKPDNWYEADAYRYVLNQLFGSGDEINFYNTLIGTFYSLEAAEFDDYKAAGFLKLSELVELKEFQHEKRTDKYLTLPELFNYKYPINHRHQGLLNESVENAPKQCYEYYDKMHKLYNHRRKIMVKAWDEARIEVYKAAAKPVIEKQIGISQSEKAGKIYFNKIRKNPDELINDVSSCILKGMNVLKKVADHYDVSPGTLYNALKRYHTTFKKIKERVSS